MRRLGVVLPEKTVAFVPVGLTAPTIRPWESMVAEARLARPERMSFGDVLNPTESMAVKTKLEGLGGEFADLHRLTNYDYAIAGVAGALAGLADVFLVQVPQHRGFLGGPAAQGGWLSNVVKDGFAQLLPDKRIRALEKLYSVPYDVSRNGILGEAIQGFGPRVHRLQSFGHDPLLGWIFGVRDIFGGMLTAVGGDGRLMVQSVPGVGPAQVGWDVFARTADALKTVGGHMLSDVATPAGLPPPLFGMLQFVQSGDVKGRNIARLSRAMYRSGYDFRHFVAGGLCTALIEVIVRVGWFVRELREGKSLTDALPVGDKPRLRTGLFLAHTAAAAVNAGKVAITQNPLSVSWAQWSAFFGYLLPQMHWMLAGREQARHQFVKGRLADGWRELGKTFEEDFRNVETNGITL